ncbi:MAG: hypothetical protein KAS81_05745 [Anaerolineales bacterium]|jgi:uncharacterized membrane protein|nr:hypothetical protein [Anaerolineales bacterium]NOR82587.1 hypothetical protein [Ardenticatenales bacterium]
MIDPALSAEIIVLTIASMLALTGFAALLMGLRTMLARDYQQTLRKLSLHSAQLSQKGLGDIAIAPALDATARLVEAVSQLVRTAVGIGVFLCFTGTAMMVAAYLMVSRLVW